MKRFLSVFLLTPLFVFSPLEVFARDVDQVGKELENINYSEIPYGVRMMDANIQITITPGVTIAPLKSKEGDAVTEYMVKDGNIRSYEKSKEVNTDILSSIFRALGNLIFSIGDLFNFGNQKARDWLGTMTPCGAADKALGAENPNCKNGKIGFYNNDTDRLTESDNTKVLGIINMAPMEKGLDLGYCMQMPYGTGDCLKNNTPFSNIQPTNSSLTITPTVSKSP